MTRYSAVVTTAVVCLVSCSETPPRREALSEGTQQISPLTEWFYSDGIILADDVPVRDADGTVRSPAREWVVVSNLSARTAAFSVTYYFEDIEPREFTGEIEPRQSRALALQDMPNLIPPGKRHGARVRSNEPILVQPTRGEYEPYNPVTEAMSSFVAYAGPLGLRETKWAYADGLVLRDDGPLEEREWISILNPSSDGAASVRIRFLRGGDQGDHLLTVPAERVRSVDLFHLDSFEANRLTTIIVESDRPVIVEQIRKAYTRGIPVVRSLWATLAYPIGDQLID